MTWRGEVILTVIAVFVCLIQESKTDGNIPKPQLKQTPVAEVLYTSEEVILDCSVQGDSSDLVYIWQKGNDNLTNSDKRYIIKSADPSHSGDYQCKVTRGNDTSDLSDVLSLSVVDLPQAQLTLKSKWTKVFDKEAVKVECNIQSPSSDWTYQWYRGSQKIGSAEDGTYSITSPQTGKHTCVGEHKLRKVNTKTSNEIDIVVYNGRPKPELTKEPASVSVFYTKEDVTLKCKVMEDSEGWTYLWYKDKTSLANTDTQSHHILSSVASADSGSYECQVERDGFTSQNSNALPLTIKDLPQTSLTMESKWTRVFPSEVVNMKCDIKPPSSDWICKYYKDDQESQSDNCLLSIQSAKPGDSGVYKCIGTHRSLQTQHSNTIEIHVYDHSPKILLSVDPTDPPIYTSEKVTLTCNVQNEQNGWTYMWYKDSDQNKPIHQGDKKAYILPSALPNQSGEYKCQVRRESFTSQHSDSKTLTIEDPPVPKLELLSKWDKVFPTETVSMKCNNIPASPDWTPKWYRSQQGISSENAAILTMSAVGSKNTGNYACQGVHKRNVETVVSNSIRVLVYDGPPNTKLSIGPSATVIYTKETVNISCQIQEESAGWQYSFFKDKDNTPLNRDTFSQSRYSISSVAPTNSGSYWCRVQRDNLSFDSNNHAFNVEDPPIPKLERLSNWDKVFPTEEVEMKCNNIPYSPDWSYKWYRNQQKLSSKSANTLKISSVGPTDTGNYTCQGVHKRHVETAVSDSIGIHVYENKAKPTLSQHPNYASLYVEEQVTFVCEVEIDSTGWEYQWFRSKIRDTNQRATSYKWKAAGTKEEFQCKAMRGKYVSISGTINIEVLARPIPIVALEIGWVDILSVEWLTLNCSVDGNFTFYTWYEDDKVMPNKTQQTLHIKATKENYQNEYKCRGNNTNRPTYSMLSEPFKANNIVLKRQILLAISGCLVVGIVLIVLGCVYFKCTRKPEEEIKNEIDLFFTMEQAKSLSGANMGSTTDLCSPGAVKLLNEEKTDSEDPLTDEQLQQAKDSQNKEEADGLTSFKGL